MPAGADEEERFVAAHKALTADTSVQFDLRVPDPPPPKPAWVEALIEWLRWVLEPLGRLVSWVHSLLPDAPYARIIFWSTLAVLVAALLWLIVQRLRHGQWRLRRPLASALSPDEEEAAWAPDAVQTRHWLEEADALAAAGRYAEAIHHLLIRSVEDIAKRRPHLVQPAVTSRELATANALPTAARAIFASIAALVERSLFGGRPVNADDWTDARRSYADFALGKAWAA